MKNIIILIAFILVAETAHGGLPPTASKGNLEPAFKTTFNTDYGTIPLVRTGTTAALGTIPISAGGTGSTTQNFVDLTTAQTAAGAKNFTSNTTVLDILYNDPAYSTISTKQALSHQMGTGVVDGSILSINAVTSKFDLSQQTLLFSDYSVSSANPVVKIVTCPVLTAQTVTNLATSDNSYISITPACGVVQSTTFPTQIQRRTNAFIGRLVHPTRTSISTAATLPDFVVDTNSQVFDLFDAMGAFNISGNVISPNGANLSLNKSAGVTFRRSVGYGTNKQNPNTVAAAGQTPVSFTRFTQTSQIIGPFTTLDVANYDVAGTVTAIPGGANVSTNKRVYIFGNGQVAIQYGQVTYASLAAAIAGISTESFVVNPTANDGGVLLAILSCRKSATDVSNATDCVIQRAGRFDNSGITVGSLATTTLQQAYDNSVTPQITTTTANGSVDIKRGSAADTDNVFRIQNGAGTSTATITGDGTVTNVTHSTTAKVLETVSTDAATTGANATVSAPTTPITRLTNASLTSIDMIATPAAGQVITLINATGAQITINDETGATATNRIRTGTGAAIPVPNNASIILKYDGVATRWRAINATASSNATIDSFNGDGTTVAFSLSVTPATENNTDVYIGGVYQEKDTYSVSGSTITFSEAPVTGTSNIEIKTYSTLSIGTPADGTVTRAKIDTASAFIVPTVQKYTTGTGVTYNTPSGVKYLKVTVIGAGGGGAGSGTSSSGGNGGNGGTSSFGTSLLTATGGAAGFANNSSNAAGGSPTINAPAIELYKVSGGLGAGGGLVGTFLPSPNGGSSVLGSGGYGAGGYGGNTTSTGTAQTGASGGAGAALQAIIVPTALQAFTFSVGTPGTLGTAGTSGQVGGAGQSGTIIIEEHYQ